MKGKQYLSGPPGTGKTARLVERLVALLDANIRPDRILVLAPQQSQAAIFRAALARVSGARRPRGEPDIGTFYGLAQQHVSLFFPLIAEPSGFRRPGREPAFMNVEAAQYFLDRLLAPRAADFDDLKLYRPRLLGQILDSMNKAAECGFALDEIAERLSAAWTGEERRLVTYQRAQEAALDFRQFCLEHSVLDFSLLLDTFARHLLRAASYQDYIAARYRHVIADNLEENPPVMHDFLSVLLRTCDSALLAEDDPGGYRLFLGADPGAARMLRPLCDAVDVLDAPSFAAPAVLAFGRALARQLSPDRGAPSTEPGQSGEEPALVTHREALGDAPGAGKYWTEMVDWVVERIHGLAAAGTPAGEIAVLAPYVEDVLRFELEDRLRPRGIRVDAVRPSRPLYDHPAVRALAALARLAHPAWQLPVAASELARALSAAIGGLDVARAQLIADAALRASAVQLPAIDDAALWQRVGMRFYDRYAALQRWLAERAQQPPAPLDLFWQQLFTEVLSQAGFGLEGSRADARADAQACDRLIRSARAFREVFERAELSGAVAAGIGPDRPPEPGVPGIAGKPEGSPPFDLGREYLEMLALGIMAAQYAPEREAPAAQDAVLLAPVYTYLTSDFRSRCQFWLDINALGWYERIYQPLTHPYVLSRRWARGRPWTEEDEHRERRDMLRRVVLGLAYRCSGRVYVASSQLGISGQEESGPLARAVQRVLSKEIGD